MAPTTSSGNVTRIPWAVCVVVGLALLPSAAGACSCAPGPPPAGAFDTADSVFLATVTDIDQPTRYPDWTYELLRVLNQRFDAFHFWPSNDKTVHLEVKTSWKGVGHTRVALRTGAGGGDCGYGFVKSHSYLIYGYRYEKRLSTGICTRTSSVAHAAEDFAFLADESPLTLIDVKPMPKRLLQVSVLIAVVCAVVAIRLMLRPRQPARV